VCVCLYLTSVRKHVIKSRVLEGPNRAKDARRGRPLGFYLVLLVTYVFASELHAIAGFT